MLLQDCHERAWNCVRTWMDSHMYIVSGRASDAESTVLPAIAGWIDRTLEDSCASGDNYSVVILLNCPTVGILGTEKKDFFVTAVTNLLNQYRRNAVDLLVLPNRAGQTTRTVFFCILHMINFGDILYTVNLGEHKKS